ncbi:MAG: hypothetical protein WED04_09345 [Promethearchaeati archaeon SRVP18_Atabeyarchaeia-1]
MTEIGREVEISLKTSYGNKWREGLLVHLLIGLGRSIIGRSQTHGRLCQEPTYQDEHVEEDGEGIRELHENPLGYIRQMNEKVAGELERQIYSIRTGPIKHESACAYPDFGELLEAIGVQAKLRLEGKGEEGLTDLLEAVIQASWEEAPLALREDTFRIIRLVGFFSTAVDQ